MNTTGFFYDFAWFDSFFKTFAFLLFETLNIIHLLFSSTKFCLPPPDQQKTITFMIPQMSNFNVVTGYDLFGGFMISLIQLLVKKRMLV
jgi:hypothetical protein